MEILLAAAVMGMIAMIVLPRLTTGGSDTKAKACEATRRNIEVEVQLWYRNYGNWPANNLADIAADPQYFPDGLPACPVDGSAYTIDGTTHHVTGHSH